MRFAIDIDVPSLQQELARIDDLITTWQQHVQAERRRSYFVNFVRLGYEKKTNMPTNSML